jgi:NADH dehydrogenase
VILLTGGTGYVGSHLLGRLRKRGEPVRVLVRDPAKHHHLETGNVGLAKGDVTNLESLHAAMQDVSTVIHLVAIIRERPGGITFERINYGGTVNVVEAAKAAGVKRIIHQSALGARPDPRLPYFDTKYRAEQYVQASGLPFAILRPSVIFGQGDEFVNKLADLVRKPLFVLPAPVVPVIGDGSTPFSPVWVGDFADAVAGILDHPELDGQVYELGGPRRITYERMIDEIMQVVGIKRAKLHVPAGLMRAPVLLMDRLLPNPPVTIEQLKMLRFDNSVAGDTTARLAGHPLKDFREGIDFVKIPIKEQKHRLMAEAAGKHELPAE